MAEMKDLSTGLMNTIKELIDDFNGDPEEFKRSSAVKFQDALVVLCFCFLGGQRKQVITDINIKVKKFQLNATEVRSDS